VKGQTLSLVWELTVSADSDIPVQCTCHVNYQRLLNDDDTTPDVYEFRHCFMVSSCKVIDESIM